MKKTYNTPEIMIVGMDNADIVTTSAASIQSGGSNSQTGAPTAAEGNSRGNAIWDD